MSKNTGEENVTLFVYVLNVPMGAELGLEIQRAIQAEVVRVQDAECA